MFGVVDKCDSFRRQFPAIFGSIRSSTDGESPLTINNFYKAAYDVAQSGDDAEIWCSDVLELGVSRHKAKSQVNAVFKQLEKMVKCF